MSEQKIAPEDQTAWYRAYWQQLGVKFLVAALIGLYGVSVLSLLTAYAILVWILKMR